MVEEVIVLPRRERDQKYFMEERVLKMSTEVGRLIDQKENKR
jgi:hypothetical protein